MNYERKEELNQVDADPCSLSGDLSMLDELFPSLGDGGSSSNHFTNQLAVLLNSFNSNEEDGATNGPPLFNPLQLSPPRLNEFHALATANLISQTQEAIMQEYNITDLDFESISNSDKNELKDGSSRNTINYENVGQTSQGHISKTETLNSDVPVSNGSYINLNCHTTEDDVAAKFLESETDLHEASQENNPVLMNTSENVSQSSIMTSKEAINVAKDLNCSQNDSVENSCEVTARISSIMENLQQLEKGLIAPPFKEDSEENMLGTCISNEHLLKDKTLVKEVKSNLTNLSSCVIGQDHVSIKHTLIQVQKEKDQAFKANGLNVETNQLKKNLLKFEQTRDHPPLETSHIKNGTCFNGDSSKGTLRNITYMCMQCQKHFKCFEDLERHKTNHQHYVCPHPGCVRTFAYRSHLSYHRKVHEKEKSYQCSECGKLFTNHQHLDVHMRIHTDSKPYVCTECDKCFTTIGNLKNHSRLHTGERPYACDFNGCDKRFSESSSLKKHKVIHTGEKSHQCDICGKSFTQNSSKRYHMKKHKLTEHLKGTKTDTVKS